MATTTLAHDSDTLTYETVRLILPGIADDISAVGLAYKRAFNKIKKNPHLKVVDAILMTSPAEYRKPKVVSGEITKVFEIAKVTRQEDTCGKHSAAKGTIQRRKHSDSRLDVDCRILFSKMVFTSVFLFCGAYILVSETSDILGGGLHGWLKASFLEFGMIALAVAKPRSIYSKAFTYSAMLAIALTTLLVLEKGIDRDSEDLIVKMKHENKEVVRLTQQRQQMIKDRTTVLAQIERVAEENLRSLKQDISDREETRRNLPENYVTKRRKLDVEIAGFRRELREEGKRFNSERKEAVELAKVNLSLIDEKIYAATSKAGSAEKIRTVEKSAVAEKSLRALILFLNIIFGHAAALYASELITKFR